VIVALPAAVKLPAVAENVAEVAFAATVTDAGTLTVDALDESVTTAPAAGAGLPSVTVQFTAVFGLRDAEPHWTEEIVIAACGCTVVLAEDPLSDAVIVTDPLVSAFDVTLKDTEVAFAGTVTDAGGVTAAELLVSSTVAPAEGAGLFSVNVHETVAFAAMPDDGHWTAETSTGVTRLREVFVDEVLRVAVIVAV
jgi:hypothetical protein